MTLPTTSVAWDIALEIKDRAAVALDPTKVYAWLPSANEQAKEVVWLDSWPSVYSYPVSKGDGRRLRNEVTTFTWKVWVSGRRTPDDTGTRLQEIVAVFDNTFAADDFLGETVAGVIEATIETSTPEVFLLDGGAGPAGTCDITATVEVRLL